MADEVEERRGLAVLLAQDEEGDTYLVLTRLLDGSGGVHLEQAQRAAAMIDTEDEDRHVVTSLGRDPASGFVRNGVKLATLGRCPPLLVIAEDLELDGEVDGGLVGHAGELTGPDHTDPGADRAAAVDG